MGAVAGAANRAGRDAYDRRSGFHVANHYGSGSHGRPSTDHYPRRDRDTYAQIGAFLNSDATCESARWPQIDEISQHAVVGNRAARIDQCMASDRNIRRNATDADDHRTDPDRNARTDHCSRMAHRNKFGFLAKRQRSTLACPAISHGQNKAGRGVRQDLKTLGTHLQASNIRSRVTCVDNETGHLFSVPLQGGQHFTTQATCPIDQKSHVQRCVKRKRRSGREQSPEV